MPNTCNLRLFDRERLYAEVWTTPMARVGDKYGVSGRVIIRLCRQLDIPTPARGHWTLVTLGRYVPQPALPALAGQIDETMLRGYVKEAGCKNGAVDLAPSAREFCEDAQRAIGSQSAPQRCHTVLRALRERLEVEARNAAALRKKHEWEHAHPGQRCAGRRDGAYASWEKFRDAGQLLLTIAHRKQIARLSLGSYKRGLALLNVLCRQAEHRGYALSMSGGDERLRLSRSGAYVDIRLAEKLVRGVRYSSNTWDNALRPIGILTPTGELALFVEQQGTGQTQLADRSNQPLENQLDQIFDAIFHRYEQSVARVAYLEQVKQRRREAEVRRSTDEKQRRIAQKIVDEECQRRQDFISEVENWNMAKLVRSYIDMLDVRDRKGGQTMDGYVKRREWALAEADELDRSNFRLVDDGAEHEGDRINPENEFKILNNVVMPDAEEESDERAQIVSWRPRF